MNSEAAFPPTAMLAPTVWGQTQTPWRWPERRLLVGVLLSLLAHGLLLSLQFDLAGLGLPDSLFSDTGSRGAEQPIAIRLEPAPDWRDWSC